MAASEITPLLAELKAYWAKLGLESASPATPEEVAAFETLHGVVLPADFREYLLTLNGVAGGFYGLKWDADRIAFLTLDQMKGLGSWARPQAPATDGLFVFGDYDMFIGQLALRLSSDAAAPTPIFTAALIPPGETVTQIATSFTAFVRGYLAGDIRAWGTAAWRTSGGSAGLSALFWGTPVPPPAPKRRSRSEAVLLIFYLAVVAATLVVLFRMDHR